MIRINLLPKQKRVKVSNVEKEIVLFVLLLILLFMGIFSANVYMTQRVEGLRNEKAQREIVRNNLLKKVKRVREIKAELKDIEDKTKAIKKIRVRQGLPVQYIDEVIKNLPGDKIWFESFQLNSSGQINITGVALDNQAFAQYVSALRNSPFIASVTTQRTSRKEIQGLGLVEFVCNIIAQPPKLEEQSNG